MKMWRWAILGGGLGLYLVGLGFLGGVVAERVRFDHQRTEVVRQYDKALRKWQAYLMKLEQTGPAVREARSSASSERDFQSDKPQTEKGEKGNE